jgi:cytochrome c biogenesis protein CcmG, thiol:disulfide interchange protein DsbE
MIKQKTRIIIALIIVMMFLQGSCTRPKDKSNDPPAPSTGSAKAPAPESAKAPVPESIEKEIPPPAPDAESASAKKKREQKINFSDIKGQKYRAEDLHGKIVLIVYWATWCPPCRQEIPVLNKIYDTYSKRNMILLAVSQDEKLSTLRDYLTKDKLGQSINYPVIYGADYVNHFGMVPVLPTLVLVNKEGNVIGKHQGLSSYEQLSKVIEEQL